MIFCLDRHGVSVLRPLLSIQSVVGVANADFAAAWINYPYLTNAAFKSAADSCHSLGMNFSVCILEKPGHNCILS